jgi:hypothetical protein
MVTQQPEGEKYREIIGQNDFIFQTRGMMPTTFIQDISLR